ncbi:hypothetical protein CRUP_036200, partial [Coryphaenoides rupestris]
MPAGTAIGSLCTQGEPGAVTAMQAGDGDPLRCCAAVERLNAAGQATSRRVIRRAAVLLGRNEFRELILRIEDGKAPPQSYALTDFRSSPSSPATASAPLQVLLSDCPPDRLGVFLRTLGIKHQAWLTAKAPTDREKLQACLPRSFDTISPLRQKDVQQANELRARGLADRTNTNTHTHGSKARAGPGLQVKRPRSQCDFSPVKANPSKKPVLTLPVARKLNKEQAAVLTAVLSGKNVFFTGSAGTGKSFLLKRIVGSLPPKSTYATASTGVAACHIAGTTLHNFAGIGSGAAPLEQCIELAQRPGVLQHWTSCRHLIIDEVSMVDAPLFDKLEAVARSVRRSTEPFGGIQLIICGDFLQLPPVSKGKEKALFCFQ